MKKFFVSLFQLFYTLQRLEKLIAEPYVTSGQVTSWKAMEFLCHLRLVLRGDEFYQRFIDKILIKTKYKVYFSRSAAHDEPLDLSIITID